MTVNPDLERGTLTVSADFVFAGEPKPELAPEPQLIDWAHRPANAELARAIDDAITGDHRN